MQPTQADDAGDQNMATALQCPADFDELVEAQVAGLRAGTPPDKRYLTSILPNAEVYESESRIIAEAVVAVFGKEPLPIPCGAARKLPFLFQSYQIVEQLGSGGFGTVYLAYDGQLDRSVAVKILHPAVTRRDRERVLHEARSAAQLRHPSIVAIQRIAEHNGELAIIYDYIDGITLSDWLDMRQLSARDAAQLIAQLADALDYAHRRGVVHRDIKPSNILLDIALQTQDTASSSNPIERLPCPMLMDFGVARRLTGSNTWSGRGMIGTRRYMSPEQATGQSASADARSDIYSLGVVLHQLLCGELPPPGAVSDLVPLSTTPAEPSHCLANHLPRDVRAICLKAIQPDPANRFQAASEMAQDLRRWLSGEPIRARTIGLVERLRLWSKRNPRVAMLSATVVLAIVVGFAGISWQWRRATFQFNRAEDNLHTALVSKAAADRSFQQSFGAVKDLLTSVSQERLLKEPGFQGLRRDLLEKALGYYQQFVLERGNDPSVRSELAAAHQNMGDILSLIGSPDDAIAAFERGRAEWAAVLLNQPDSPQPRRELAVTHGRIAKLQAATGHVEQALQSLDQAQLEFERLLEQRPRDAQARTDLAKCIDNRALLVARLRTPSESLRLLENARAIFQAVAADNPHELDHNFSIAENLINTAFVTERTGAATTAIDLLSQANEILQQIVQQRPTDPRYQQSLATSLNNLAEMARNTGRFDEASRAFERALETNLRLAHDNPLVSSYQNDLASTFMNLGLLLTNLQQWDRAEQNIERSIKIREELAERHPDDYRIIEAVARSKTNLAQLYAQRGDFDAAIRTQRHALELRVRLAKTDAANTEYVRAVARSQFVLGDLLRAAGNLEEASTILQEAHAGFERLTALQTGVLVDQYFLGIILDSLGQVAWKSSGGQAALDLLRSAMAHLRTAHDAAPDVLNYREALSDAMQHLADRLLETGQLQGAMDLAIARRQLWQNDRQQLGSIARDLAAWLKLPRDADADRTNTDAARERIASLAIEILRDAIALDPTKPLSVQNDPVLQTLREHPEFLRLFAEKP